MGLRNRRKGTLERLNAKTLDAQFLWKNRRVLLGEAYRWRSSMKPRTES